MEGVDTTQGKILHGKILQLRALLQERHPGQSGMLPATPSRLTTGIPVLDDALEGGLYKGGIVELSSPRTGTGVSLLVNAMLQHTAASGLWSALVDGSDCFDPQSAGAGVLSHLLWLRCHTAQEALQSTDLLLRDGNLPLVLLDLRGNSARNSKQLSGITGPTWYRLQRLLENSSVALLVLTPRPMVAACQARLHLEHSLTLDALEQSSEQLLPRLELQMQRKRALAWAQAG